MSKGVIYYTDNNLREPIFSTVQQTILASHLPIVSVSLAPLDFGKNIVLDLTPSYITMLLQIVKALEMSDATYVFFCEHDVLYPPSHFEFTPPTDTIFYYNANVWRWGYPTNMAIAYDRLISLSGLSVNRQFALTHYQKRLKRIKDLGLTTDHKKHEPGWARKWGYEPGTKKIKRGGFSDDDFETWRSAEPLVDIRHGRTFSQSKVTLQSFIHKPTGWRETTLDQIPGVGWDLATLFNLSP